MANPPQNSSREMILPAYKAAISLGLPILPTQHHIRKNRASRIENPATYVPIRHSTSVENPLQIHPFLYKRTQSCPPPADSKPFIWQRITQNMALRQDPKTNPNEPKRTQSKPNFSPIRGPQSQNEPKQTQNKANSPKTQKSTQPQSPQRVTTMNPPSALTGTNPIYRGEACLPRRSTLRSRDAKPERTQPVAAKPACPGGVLYEAGMAKPEQSQFPKNPKINSTSVTAKGYDNEPPFSLNRNEPNLSRRSLPAAAKYSTKPGCEAGTNPTCRGEACLPRRSALRSRDGEAGTKPIPQKPKNQRNSFSCKALRQKSQILPHQSKAKGTQFPKQTNPPARQTTGGQTPDKQGAHLRIGLKSQFFSGLCENSPII